MRWARYSQTPQLGIGARPSGVLCATKPIRSRLASRLAMSTEGSTTAASASNHSTRSKRDSNSWISGTLAPEIGLSADGDSP
jgi:hypothetical protein